MPRLARWIRLAATLLVMEVLTPASPLMAQATQTGSVAGQLIDAATGAPIAGAQVVVPGTNLAAITDATGRFLIVGVPMGERELQVLRLGYSSTSFTVDLAPGQSSSVILRLGGRSPPVYNLLLQPDLGGEQIRLVDGEPTQLRFSIGPPLEGSVLPGEPVSQVLQLADEPTPLEVVMDCFVCDEAASQFRRIVYQPADGVSETARFEVVASASRVEDSGGLGRIVFSVLLEGVEIDVIEVPVLVGDATPEAVAAYLPPRQFAIEDLPMGVGAAPDVVIFVGPSSGGSARLPVGILAIDPTLDQRLRDAVGGRGPVLRFTSGVTERDLQELSAQAYIRLSEIVRDGNTILDDVYAGTTEEAVDLSTDFRLNAADSAAVVRALKAEGEGLFSRVFEDGTQRLLMAVHILETLGQERLEAGDPLSIRIHNSAPYVPWQLMSSTTLDGDRDDPERFWGLRYALGVRQDVSGRVGRIGTFIDPPGSGEVLLATHADDPQIEPRARRMRERVDLVTGASAEERNRRDPFLEYIDAAVRNLKFLLFFTHGSSGASVEHENPYLPRSPELLFRDDEKLTPGDIRRFRNLLDSGERLRQVPILASRPMVFLNACESGTGGLSPTTNNGFVGAFLGNGASAVVATESAIWVGFASRFGTDLMEELFRGAPAAEALRLTRARHLRHRGNALGLAYSLYGNPSASFVN